MHIGFNFEFFKLIPQYFAQWKLNCLMDDSVFDVSILKTVYF